MNEIAQQEGVKMQKDMEVEEEEAGRVTCSYIYSGKPYVSNVQTMADLEANMYDHRKRVIFSQSILKAMSMERTVW